MKSAMGQSLQPIKDARGGVHAAVLAALSLTIGANCYAQVTLQVTPAKDGSRWCATDKAAVHIGSDGSAKIYNKSTGLNDDLVTQVIPYADGAAWFVHAGVFGPDFSPKLVVQLSCAKILDFRNRV